MKTVFPIGMAAISMALVVYAGLCTGALAPQTARAAGPGVHAPGADTAALTPDFTVSTTPATQNVAAGGSATFTVTVISLNGTFEQPVVLDASGLPPGSIATFSPASVTPGARSATTTLTIETVAQDAATIPGLRGNSAAGPLLGLLLVLPLGVGWRTRFRLSWWTALIATVGMMQGCESESALPLTEQVASQATYTMTVTGTSGSTQHSVVMELLVQTGSGFNT